MEDGIRCGEQYIKSYPGALKIVEIVSSLIALIILIVLQNWDLVIILCALFLLLGMLGSAVVLTAHLLHKVPRGFAWIRGQFIWFTFVGMFCMVWFILLIYIHNKSSMKTGVSVAFGCISCLAYLIDGCYNYIKLTRQ